MLIEIFKLVLGLYFAIKGADILVTSAVSLGRKFKVSEFFIGLVLIGFGTSISELLVSIDAVLNNSSDLSVGNILGSNIANLLLIFSVVGFINNIKIKSISAFDISFHLIIHIIFFIIFNFYTFNKVFGSLFIVIFIFYIIASFKISKKEGYIDSFIEEDFFSVYSFKNPLMYGLPILLFSIALTLFGVDLAVNSAIKVSTLLNIPDSFIGLSIIAIGTSLPELITSISAAKKGKGDLIFGNIIGSNIYNLLLILGISSLFDNFKYSFMTLQLDVLIVTLLIIFFSVIFFKRITITTNFSVMCLATYILYLINLFYRNF